ncbi:hypothetical protein PM082_016030 [Marasmius tenuissimus]|nr:hypothetical protein PM082_016030 [Marasmius tenuissimus]
MPSSLSASNSSACHILALPDDVLLGILGELSVSALISVQQTCRVLHAFCSSDYIWHSIDIDLPLNVGPHVNSKSLPGPELRKLAVEALRIDHTWGRCYTAPRTLERIQHGGIIAEMCLLSPEWLVTLSHNSNNNTWVLSAWHLRQDSIVRVRSINLDAFRLPKLVACLQHGGETLAVAIYCSSPSRTELLRVYEFPLHDTGSDSPTGSSRYLACQFAGLDIHGTPFGAHICQAFVAIGLAQFDNPFDPPKYRILILERKGCAHKIIELPTPEPFAHMQFRLFPGTLVVTGLHQGHLICQKYDLTGLAFTNPSEAVEFRFPPPTEHFISPAKVSSLGATDYRLSADHFSESLASISAFTYNQPSDARHVHAFSLSGAPVTAQKLPSSDATIDMICMGHTGRRAVWLERRWNTDTDAFVLMKGSFGRTPLVAPLVPSHVALPFVFHACQSLAFDEATGRVCVALHTGDIYLLDF